MFRTAVTICLALASVGQLVAQWRVQNDTAEKVDVSIAFGQQDGTYVSQGWWAVAPCGSAVVHSGALAVTGAFVYAKSSGGTLWEGDNLFCVDEGKRFSLIRQGNCESRGLKTVGFRLEKVNKMPYTTHLTNPAKRCSSNQ